MNHAARRNVTGSGSVESERSSNPSWLRRLGCSASAPTVESATTRFGAPFLSASQSVAISAPASGSPGDGSKIGGSMTKAASAPLKAAASASALSRSATAISHPLAAQRSPLARSRTTTRSCRPSASRARAAAPPTFPVTPIIVYIYRSPSSPGEGVAVAVEKAQAGFACAQFHGFDDLRDALLDREGGPFAAHLRAHPAGCHQQHRPAVAGVPLRKAFHQHVERGFARTVDFPVASVAFDAAEFGRHHRDDPAWRHLVLEGLDEAHGAQGVRHHQGDEIRRGNIDRRILAGDADAGVDEKRVDRAAAEAALQR